MVLNNDLIGDLKKYNKELESHFSNLDFSSINDFSSSKSNYEESEYFSLFANNLMDLKTEMALMRKNLTSDVEGMVHRLIKEEQESFRVHR